VPSHSNDSRSSLWDRATAHSNVAIYAAIVVAVPTAYGFHSVVDAGAGDFLLLMTLAVGVPTSYNDHWPSYDRTWKVVAWVLVTCVLATAAFTGLYLVARDGLALSPFPASAGAFTVTFTGVYGVPFALFGRGDG
jgi:hypothetical protein